MSSLVSEEKINVDHLNNDTNVIDHLNNDTICLLGWLS